MPRRGLRSSLRQWLLQPAGPGAPPARVGAPEAILYRILGNDRTPLVPSGTTLQQLRFLLENEPSHPGLERRWLLHRIADPEQRQALIALLEQHRQLWQEVPFEAEAYAACWTDSGAVPPSHHPWNERFADLAQEEQSQVLDYLARAKSRYLFNGNAACNHALQLGWADTTWVFAWDASCFLSAEAWQVIRPLLALPDLTYIAVPTASLLDNQQLLQGLSQPPLADGLPLLGFARTSRTPFAAQLRQGSGADADLPRRLGLAGPWQRPAAECCPWEAVDTTPLPDRARLVQAGWAYRLAPQPPADLRQHRDALRLIARKTDMRLLGEALQRQPLRCWIGLDRGDAPTPGLAAIAANARAVPPPSVTDKPETLPGTPERSYVNAVPHWQSLAGSERALNRSALLSQGMPPTGDVAQQVDRPRLQLMVDCVCALALDAQLNGNRTSQDHAALLVRTWFLDPATAMIPDGAYARLSAVDAGRNALDAALDFRDLYPLLDALTLLQRGGCFSLAERQQLEEWFDAFLAWLAEGSAAFLQHHSATPVCTWYHLLMLAIAAYRGRKNVAAQVFDNLPGLLAHQFRADGSPRSAPAETTLRHEHLFNLQAWANLVVLSSALGRDLLAFTDSNGIGLRAAFAHARRRLPDGPAGDDGLSAAQWLQAMQAISQVDASHPPELPPLPEASSGLPPFWSLCRPVARG